MKKLKKAAAALLAVLLLLGAMSCGTAEKETGSAADRSAEETGSAAETGSTEKTTESVSETAQEEPESEESTTEAPESTAKESTAAETEKETEEAAAEVEKNGDVYILFTSDIHCGIDQGFGLAGVQAVRENLEALGYTTILVDDGDAIQGEALGTLTKGEAIVDLMNAMHYDAAIPGNHEFDYGMERFLELAEKAEYPYISCNFVRGGETVFEPFVIVEAAGMKIGFVGVTTPKTITSSTPAYFQDENGEYIYGFLQDDSGEQVYEAVQKAVDGAREAGADYVYVMGHVGLEAECAPWTYADIIEHTSGIDVFLDGHSHDTEQVVMKNRDGEDVVRSACGTKLNCIGYSHISAEDGIVDTNIWSWPNKDSLAGLLGIQNEISEKTGEAVDNLNTQLREVVAENSVLLTVNDPEAVDESGNPIRMVRRAETNLGDFCADAFRLISGADIGVMNGGGIRKNLEKGEITYGDIINVFPFGNQLCVVEATGQQILDALEWASKAVPEESGAFLQVSGMSYEIDASIESSCESNENRMFTGVSGERRVKNVMIGKEALDPAKTYTVAGTDYTLLKHGDGTTAFDGCTLLQECVALDNQALIDYIIEILNGEIGGEYAELTGQERIVITE